MLALSTATRLFIFSAEPGVIGAPSDAVASCMLSVKLSSGGKFFEVLWGVVWDLDGSKAFVGRACLDTFPESNCHSVSKLEKEMLILLEQKSQT